MRAVDFVETHSDAPFIRIFAQALAQVQSARYVMVLEPVGLYGEHGPEPPQLPPEPVTPGNAGQGQTGAARAAGR